MPATPVIGVDSMNAYYDPRLKEARLRELEGRAGFAFHGSDLADREQDRGAVCRRAAGAGHPHGGPGGGALLARRSARLHGRQYRRLPERPGGLPPQRRRASDLRVLELGLRRQHDDAVLGARQRRPSREPLRRQQEGQRADGPLLQPSLWAADHGLALLHGLRPVGAAGHGALQLHQGHPRRPADPGLQRRAHAPRLHLHRRRRRGRAARERARAGAQPAVGRRAAPTPAAARRPIGSTTSATASRWT